MLIRIDENTIMINQICYMTKNEVDSTKHLNLYDKLVHFTIYFTNSRSLGYIIKLSDYWDIMNIILGENKNVKHKYISIEYGDVSKYVAECEASYVV